jgi:hypothetical protein
MSEMTTTHKLPYSVVSAALARDCAPALRQNIPRIERLRKYFASGTVILVENVSIDDTNNILENWSA